MNKLLSRPPYLRRFLSSVIVGSAVCLFSLPAYSDLAIKDLYVCKNRYNSNNLSYLYPSVYFRIINNGEHDVDTGNTTHKISVTDHTNKVELMLYNYSHNGGMLRAGYTSKPFSYSMHDPQAFMQRGKGQKTKTLDMNDAEIEIVFNVMNNNTSMSSERITLKPGDFSKLDSCQ
ncbi:MAG: hypothetical protein HQL64_07675 [Magnetococcales bacterium]|nr:hypothetical protein [Magnetococcales bacterium]